MSRSCVDLLNKHHVLKNISSNEVQVYVQAHIIYKAIYDKLGATGIYKICIDVSAKWIIIAMHFFKFLHLHIS